MTYTWLNRKASGEPERNALGVNVCVCVFMKGAFNSACVIPVHMEGVCFVFSLCFHNFNWSHTCRMKSGVFSLQEIELCCLLWSKLNEIVGVWWEALLLMRCWMGCFSTCLSECPLPYQQHASASFSGSPLRSLALANALPPISLLPERPSLVAMDARCYTRFKLLPSWTSLPYLYAFLSVVLVWSCFVMLVCLFVCCLTKAKEHMISDWKMLANVCKSAAEFESQLTLSRPGKMAAVCCGFSILT